MIQETALRSQRQQTVFKLRAKPRSITPTLSHALTMIVLTDNRCTDVPRGRYSSAASRSATLSPMVTSIAISVAVR